MHCARKNSGDQAARGYTLIELLVVLLIAGLLIATALPVAATMLEDARTREASRIFNSYFAMAKSRAVATGRPCALWMEVDPGGLRQVTQCYLAESPPLYGGSSMPAARAWVEGGVLTFKDAATEKAYLVGLVNKDDFIMVRFDYKGDWFSFQYDGTDFKYIGATLNTTQPPGVPVVRTAADAGKPFQVMRLPQRIGSAYELTSGTAIDLVHSGYGQSDTSFATTQSRLMVVFASSGSVQKVIRMKDGATASDPAEIEMIDPTSTIHFLVGRIEKTGITTGDTNLADPTSLWVSVGAATGVVMTSENMPNPSDPTNVTDAREAASNREQMGGR